MKKIKRSEVVDEYIESFDSSLCFVLDELRDIILSFPGYGETVSDGVPTYTGGGRSCSVCVADESVVLNVWRCIPDDLREEFRWAGYRTLDGAVMIRPGQRIPRVLIRELIG